MYTNHRTAARRVIGHSVTVGGGYIGAADSEKRKIEFPFLELTIFDEKRVGVCMMKSTRIKS